MYRVIGMLVFWAVFLSAVSFGLEAPTFKSPEYIVSASRVPLSRFQSPWNATVLTSEDIKSMGAENLAEAMEYLAGVDVKRTGALGAQSSIKLRGSTYQQVLVLVNGARINSPLLGGAQIEDVLLEEVERVEIVRAPVSAVYGADAAGGVVNVITKNADTFLGTKIRAGYGSYLNPNLALSTGGRIGAVDCYLAASSIYDKGFRDNSAYKAGDGLIALGWDSFAGRWDLTAGQYNAQKGLPGVPSTEAQPTSASTPGDKQYDWRTFYDLHFSKDELKVRAYTQILKQQTHIFNFTGSVFADTEYLAQERAGEVSHGVQLANHQLSYGLDYRESYGKSDYAGEHTISNTGIFLEDQLSFGKQLWFTLGGRGDRHSVIGDNLSPRVGLVWSPWKDVFLKSSLSYAFRAPTLNDLYWNDPVWQMYGSTSLKSEKTRSAEITLERRLGEASYGSITYYDLAITDLILWNFDPVTFITRAENIDSARVNGIEFEYVQRLLAGLNGFLNYTLVDAKNTGQNAGKWLPYAAQTKANAGLSYKGKDFSSAVNLRLVGARYTDNANTAANQLPAYTLVDLSLSKEFLGLQLSAYVDNLFDQVYYESLGYHPVTWTAMKYPMPGRVVRVELGLSF